MRATARRSPRAGPRRGRDTRACRRIPLPTCPPSSRRPTAPGPARRTGPWRLARTRAPPRRIRGGRWVEQATRRGIGRTPSAGSLHHDLGEDDLDARRDTAPGLPIERGGVAATHGALLCRTRLARCHDRVVVARLPQHERVTCAGVPSASPATAGTGTVTGSGSTSSRPSSRVRSPRRPRRRRRRGGRDDESRRDAPAVQHAVMQLSEPRVDVVRRAEVGGGEQLTRRRTAAGPHEADQADEAPGAGGGVRRASWQSLSSGDGRAGSGCEREPRNGHGATRECRRTWMPGTAGSVVPAAA